MSTQTTISFNIRKNSFYGSKNNSPQVDYSNASLRNTPTTKYTPTVKKIVDISSESESESDSDVENYSKNNKCITPKTSRTPRGKKKISNAEENDATPPKLIKSPSSNFSQLTLDSPVKHSKFTPKKLFSSHKYSKARKALHSAVPENLIGRESEQEKLENFIQSHLDNQSSGSIYVSGAPGTGKTACLSKIMIKPNFKKSFKIIYINCTSMKSAASIYSKVCEELDLQSQKSGRNCKTLIENYLAKPKSSRGSNNKMTLLVLDEMDQLGTKNQAVLYSIFEWPKFENSKLVLVGIANALDLTDRLLPRLQARCELKPTLLHFQPYSKEQILNILKGRLEEENVLEVYTPSALQMLAAKVAATSGDIRRALDIGRRGVEIAEAQKMSQILQPCNNSETKINVFQDQESVNEKPVDLKDVKSVMNGVYGGSNNADSEENSFPMQQKVLLCSLMLILNKGNNKDINIGKLYTVYRKVCDKRNIQKLDMSELVNLCALIDTRGIIELTKKKESRLSKISLKWDQEELTAALQDKALTFAIVNDVSCL